MFKKFEPSKMGHAQVELGVTPLPKAPYMLDLNYKGTAKQLIRYRDVVFPKSVIPITRPTRIPGDPRPQPASPPRVEFQLIRGVPVRIPILSLETHAQWITEGALRLFEELYVNNANEYGLTIVDADDMPMWKLNLVERQREREERRERERRELGEEALRWFDDFRSSAASGGEEWTHKVAGRDVVVLDAYRSFILPPEMAFHPFFEIPNAKNWVMEAPFALFEEWYFGGRNPWTRTSSWSPAVLANLRVDEKEARKPVTRKPRAEVFVFPEEDLACEEVTQSLLGCFAHDGARKDGGEEAKVEVGTTAGDRNSGERRMWSDYPDFMEILGNAYGF